MIFDPISLRGGLNLKNRLVLAPMTTYSSLADGTISPDELPYLHERAAGGFGMVMTAACNVHAWGKAFDGQWGCENDSRLPSLRAVVEAIHSGGATAVLQIHHGGRQCPSRLTGRNGLSASAIPAERPNAETPDAMTEEEIELTIQAFADAAVRAREAGFDGVEIHGANTYLLQQYVSPHSNRRTDQWSEPLAFPLAITQTVLAAVGPDFAVGYRFSPEEIETPGIRWPLTETLIEALSGLPLAWLHLSVRDFRAGSLVGDFDEPTTQRVARVINGRVPLISVGSVRTEADAEALLALGADLVAIGRCAISEPRWPSVVLAGETPRTKVPHSGAQESLVLPKGLADKIYATPGWFEVESAV
ncbi:MAG: NADH-dependent flavin oxidoreductase [Fimbriimonas sp.]